MIPNLRMDLRFKLYLVSGCLYDSAVERHDHFSNLLPIKLEIEDTLGRGLARGRPRARGGPYTEIIKILIFKLGIWQKYQQNMTKSRLDAWMKPAKTG